MTLKSPSELAVEADLVSAAFRAGVSRGHWRQLLYAYPILHIEVSSIEPDGSPSKYCFRFELTGFPGVAPQATIWDAGANIPLATAKRPKGTSRVIEAFKQWGNDTIYRPWDRQGGPHNNWSVTHPDLAWNSSRRLTFALEDIHGLLNSNALAQIGRLVA